MGPRTCIFETLLPVSFLGPLLPKHGWAVFPPWVITALLQTHAQEIKYSSRTYWLLQWLLGKANETDSRKEMSVRHRVGGGGAMMSTRVGRCLLASASLGSSFWKQAAPSILGVLNLSLYPCPQASLPLHQHRASTTSLGRQEFSFTFQYIQGKI